MPAADVESGQPAGNPVGNDWMTELDLMLTSAPEPRGGEPILPGAAEDGGQTPHDRRKLYRTETRKRLRTQTASFNAGNGGGRASHPLERASTRDILVHDGFFKTAGEAFNYLDADDNGVLDLEEVAQLFRELNQEMDKKELKKSFREMDRDGNGKVTRGEFQRWWNVEMESVRRTFRRSVREAFDRLDRNKDGAITKYEFGLMMRKRKLRKSMRLMQEHNGEVFDVDKDWAELEAEAAITKIAKGPGLSPTRSVNSPKVVERMVTFTDFEKWWQKRMGIDYVHDIPVLPEYMAKMINELSIEELKAKMITALKTSDRPVNALKGGQDKDGEPKARTGRDHWNFLRPRLKLLTAMQKQWGDIHDLYESHTMSYFEDIPLPPWVLDPESTFSVVWDGFQLIFLLYVSVTVPLRTCFEIDVPVGSFWFFVDNVVDVYFITDMVLQFRTAYTRPNGEREDRPSKITEHYLKGWFLIDFVACVPVQYIEYAIKAGGDQGSASTGNIRAVKMVRLVRMTKMLRLARIKRMLEKYQDSAASVMQYMGMYFLVAIILFVAHMLTCFFYLVGDGTEVCNWVGFDESENDCRPDPKNPGSRILMGWVPNVFGHSSSCAELPIINGTKLPCDVVGVGTRYVTSLYFVFNALEPHFQTTGEKGFAVMAELAMAAIYGALAGVMSTILMGMRGNEQESQNKLRALRQWMVDKKMDKAMQQRISLYFNQLWSARAMFDESAVLAEMPPSMSAEVSTYIYGMFLKTIPLFRGLGDEIIFQLCLAVKPMLALKTQSIMEEGQPGTEMYLLMHGEVEVSQNGECLGFLSEGSFFGEIPVLTESVESGSEIRTRTVKAVTECELCYLPRDSIRELQALYPDLNAKLTKFSNIGRKRKKLSDYVEKEDFARLAKLKIGVMHPAHAARVRAKQKAKMAARAVKEHGTSNVGAMMSRIDAVEAMAQAEFQEAAAHRDAMDEQMQKLTEMVGSLIGAKSSGEQ